MYNMQLKDYSHNYDQLCHLATFLVITINLYVSKHNSSHRLIKKGVNKQIKLISPQ